MWVSLSMWVWPPTSGHPPLLGAVSTFSIVLGMRSVASLLVIGFYLDRSPIVHSCVCVCVYTRMLVHMWCVSDTFVYVWFMCVSVCLSVGGVGDWCICVCVWYMCVCTCVVCVHTYMSVCACVFSCGCTYMGACSWHVGLNVNRSRVNESCAAFELWSMFGMKLCVIWSVPVTGSFQSDVSGGWSEGNAYMGFARHAHLQEARELHHVRHCCQQCQRHHQASSHQSHW